MVLRKTLYYHLSESGVCIACLCVQKMLASSNKIWCFASASVPFSLVSIYLLVYVGRCARVRVYYISHMDATEKFTSSGPLLQAYGSYTELRSSGLATKSLFLLSHLAITLPHFLKTCLEWFPFYSSIYSIYKLFYCDVFLGCILVLGSCLNLDILFPVIFSLTLQRASTHQVQHQRPLTIPTENFLCSTLEVEAVD